MGHQDLFIMSPTSCSAMCKEKKAIWIGSPEESIEESIVLVNYKASGIMDENSGLLGTEKLGVMEQNSQGEVTF